MSSLHASNYITFQSNLYSERDPETLAPVNLPGFLADLIAQLSSENRFPEPWTDIHSSHSEFAAIANWLMRIEEDAEKEGKEFELPRQSGGRITTIYRPDPSQDEQTSVVACPNCKILLDYFGIEDLNEEEYTEGDVEEVETSTENMDGT